MGGDEFSESYLIKLESDISDIFNQLKSQNESKNLFKSARTPAVLIAVMIFFYMVSGIFGLIGLYSLAGVANMLMGVAIITLATWAYVRYSGSHDNIGQSIDQLANVLWDKMMKPLYQLSVERSVEQAVKEATRIVINQNVVNGTLSSSHTK